VAYLVEKKRYARDCEQCRRERHAAETEARARLSELESAQRRTIFASDGLCLGFGTILSDLTIAEELREGVDHVDGRVVLDSVPIRIDPMSTDVTVAGEPAQLRTMAFAWISEPCCAWRLSAELAQLPELTGTGLGTDVAPASPVRHGQPTGDPIDIRLDETAHPAVLTLCGPHTASSVSIALGTLAQARPTASTAPRGPARGRP